MPDDLATWLCGVAIVIGVVGVIVPVLPGTLVIAIAVTIWAIIVQTTGGWIVLVIVLALLGIGEVVKYLTAGKKMVSSGVPRGSLIIAGLVGIVGFFVVPVIGLPIGFVGGLTLAEYVRKDSWPDAWAGAKVALAAVGIVMLVEIGSALLSATTWAIGVANGAAG